MTTTRKKQVLSKTATSSPSPPKWWRVNLSHGDYGTRGVLASRRVVHDQRGIV